MNRKEQANLEQNLYITGLFLPCIGALIWVLQGIFPPWVHGFFSMPCIFHSLTGYYCPGCGGTRAAICLLQGKIGASFLYHPIVPYCAALYLWFMATHTLSHITSHKVREGMHYQNGYLWGALGIVVSNLAVKNIALTAFGIDFLNMLDSIYFN